MANELAYRHDLPGRTVYATVRNESRQMWSTVASALEALTVANWANYVLALTETPASSYLYVGNWPVLLTTEAYYWIDYYERVGAAPAINDDLVATLLCYWDGTSLRFSRVDDAILHMRRFGAIVCGNTTTAQQVPEKFEYDGLRATVAGDSKGNRSVTFEEIP